MWRGSNGKMLPQSSTALLVYFTSSYSKQCASIRFVGFRADLADRRCMRRGTVIGSLLGISLARNRMSLFENCSACKGQGSLPCECLCAACKATGKVPVKCSWCQSGKAKCDRCASTGRLLEKKGWFSDKYRTCPLCHGTGERLCGSCGGTTLVQGTCTSCSGSSRNARCPNCSGKGKVTCTSCKGAGRFEGQWVKSLDAMPVDRLRFEFEKRQREISNLQREISIAGLLSKECN